MMFKDNYNYSNFLKDSESALITELKNVIKSFLFEKGLEEKDYKELLKLANTKNLSDVLPTIYCWKELETIWSILERRKLYSEINKKFIEYLKNNSSIIFENNYISLKNSLGSYEKYLDNALMDSNDIKLKSNKILNKVNFKNPVESGFTNDVEKEKNNLKTTLNIYKYLISETPKGYKELLKQNEENLFTYYLRFCRAKKSKNGLKTKEDLIKNIHLLDEII